MIPSFLSGRVFQCSFGRIHSVLLELGVALGEQLFWKPQKEIAGPRRDREEKGGGAWSLEVRVVALPFPKPEPSLCSACYGFSFAGAWPGSGHSLVVLLKSTEALWGQVLGLT